MKAAIASGRKPSIDTKMTCRVRLCEGKFATGRGGPTRYCADPQPATTSAAHEKRTQVPANEWVVRGELMGIPSASDWQSLLLDYDFWRRPVQSYRNAEAYGLAAVRTKETPLKSFNIQGMKP